MNSLTMDMLKRQYTKPRGTLIIIGGHEDREGECVILKEVARRARTRKNGKQHKQIVVSAAASSMPHEMLSEYERIFKKLGVEDIGLLSIRDVNDAHSEENARMIEEANVLFFTGGDQLRLTSQIGVTPVYDAIYQLYLNGGTIVGTSAGAAAMSETMLVSGDSNGSNEIQGLDMGSGLGLLREVVIDSHFAERGRMGRLLGAVAQNPRSLGIGIDENTAIIVEHAQQLRVLGSGAVYVVEGRYISYSALSEEKPEGIISMFDIQVHVLADGYCFDLQTRRPIVPKKIEEELAAEGQG